MHQDVKKILVSLDEIVKRSEELGKEIKEDYESRNEIPLVVGLLKGSVPFLAELVKHIDMDIIYEFMAVSSYEGTESVGKIKVNLDLQTPVQGKPVLLVEDIIDTGRTIEEVKKLILEKGASSVKVVSLLDKPERRVVDVNADFVGFVVPNEFVIGYGLDYNQKYRNLPFIGVLKDECYQ